MSLYCFFDEYKVPVKIVRLTQTFGAGISSDENRVFAQFSKSVFEKKDLVLHTKGVSSKPYVYTTDAIMALFYIFLNGINGEAYNIANPNTYISIKDMAFLLKNNFARELSVIFDNKSNMGYAPETHLRLDVTKLTNLGWTPKYNLYTMFERLISSFTLK